jgi:hypothetical protein
MNSDAPYESAVQTSLIPFMYRSKKAFIFLKFNTKKKEGGGKLPPSTFQSGEGN